jgi:hypothetical protein
MSAVVSSADRRVADDRADAVAASRRTVAWLLSSVAVLCTALAALAPITVGGDRALLALPTMLHGGLVLTTVVVMLAMRTGLRVDALTLFVAWELLRGCVAPVILMTLGPATTGFFYRLGTWSDARTVLFVGNLFLVVVVCVRVALAAVEQHLREHRRGTRPVRPLPSQARLVAGRLPAWPLIALGLIGLAIRFPTIGAVTGFLAGDVDALQGNDEIGASGLLLASLLLRPLLVVGLVTVAWRRRRSAQRYWHLLPLLALAVVFALASYGLNRGTVAFCVLSFALLFVERSRHALRVLPVVTAVVVLGGFFVGIGTLRATLWTQRTGLDPAPLDLASTARSVLGYAASPLQLSAALPTVEAASPFGLRTFALSLLSPIPGAPSIARTGSGTAIYNNVIYHSFVGKDQLLPSWFEGWISFGLLGVVAVAVALAALFALSDALRRRSRTVLATYGTTLFALWLSQAGVTSIGVIEQNTVNFVLTPLVIAAVAHLWPHRATSPSIAPRKAQP